LDSYSKNKKVDVFLGEKQCISFYISVIFLSELKLKRILFLVYFLSCEIL